MLNLTHTKWDKPEEWWHIHSCFDDKILSRVIQHFPEPKEAPITGKRDGANDFRKFASRMHTPVLAKLFEEFDSAETRKQFTDLTGVDCGNGHLRVELCQDSAGFYLEPHIDIPEKLITMQIYLQGGKPAWGTSIHRKVGIFQTVPFVHNTGWLSHNKSPLIHGVRENVVDGIRKSVIINYVVGEWRDKEQLY